MSCMAIPNSARELSQAPNPTGPEPVSRYAGFAHRLTQCADFNPHVPSLGRGRLTFVGEKLASRGAQVSLEAVRKWFSGQAIPRREYQELLAELLQADVRWLLE